ncbi:MAG: GHKL domain-containing protein [Lachnospiraceae bacterium]|nr:GHKL domain-containing protein [Lachnospiraceae bacterium]
MIYWIFSFVLTAIDTWCVLYLLDTFLKKKDVGRLEKVRFWLFLSVIFSVAVLFHVLDIVINLWKFVLIFIALFVLGFIYFKTTVKQMIFYLPLCYGIVVLVEFLTLSVGGLFIETINLSSEEHNYIFGTLAKLCEVLVVLCVRRMWKSPNEFQTLKRKEWYMLICIPLFSISGVVGMFRLFNGNEEIRNICLFLTMGLVAINFITIYLLQDILDKSEQLRVSTLANQNAKNQIEAYHDMDALYECQRRKMHDYKNQIVTIQSLVQGGNTDKAVNLMEQLTESISVDLSAINTNHPVVNAVLNHKFHTAKEKQIAMIFQVGDVHEICLTEEEIVILLGNLLDNAIAECERVVRAGKDAVIQFKFIYEEGKVILSIKNPVFEKVQIVDNKVQVNAKSGHGIGLKNVEAVVEKYDGSIAFDCDEKEFRAVVIL